MHPILLASRVSSHPLQVMRRYGGPGQSLDCQVSVQTVEQHSSYLLFPVGSTLRLKTCSQLPMRTPDNVHALWHEIIVSRMNRNCKIWRNQLRNRWCCNWKHAARTCTMCSNTDADTLVRCVEPPTRVLPTSVDEVASQTKCTT